MHIFNFCFSLTFDERHFKFELLFSYFLYLYLCHSLSLFLSLFFSFFLISISKFNTTHSQFYRFYLIIISTFTKIMNINHAFLYQSHTNRNSSRVIRFYMRQAVIDHASIKRVSFTMKKLHFRHIEIEKTISTHIHIKRAVKYFSWKFPFRIIFQEM